MLRSTFRSKNIILGESSDFNEIFSLNLDEGRGSYVFLISVGNVSSDQAREFCYALNQTFKEEFLNQSKVLFDRFEEAVVRLNRTFLELIETMQLADVGFKAAIMAESNGKILFTRSGLAEIYLVRGDELINLSEVIYFDESSTEIFDNVVSGDIKKDDVYFISNDRFLRYFVESELVKFVHKDDLTEVVEWMAEKIKPELQDELLLGMYKCEDLVYKALEKVEVKDFNFYLRSFNRTLKHIFRSIITGNVRSIDFDLRKKIVGLVVLLVFVVAGTSLWLAHRSVVRSQLDRYRDELEVAALIISNARSEFDKGRVSVMLQNAEAKINSVRGFQALQKEADLLVEQIKQIKSNIDNVVTVDKPEVFQSVVSLSESNFSLRSVFATGANVMTSTQNRMYNYVAGVGREPVNFDPGSGIYTYAWNKENQTLFALSRDGSIVRLSSGLVNYLDVVGQNIEIGTSAAVYNNRLYILDKENAQIWRHDFLRNSVAGKVPYLGQGYGRFVTEAKDLAIDGYIYVVTENGDFFRFLRGQLDTNFAVTVRPLVSLTKPDKILTDIDNPFMFVLENSEKRIIQYFKSQSRNSLEYTRQYYFPNLANINDFWVDYLARKIYIVDDKNIYVTDLIES